MFFHFKLFPKFLPKVILPILILNLIFVSFFNNSFLIFAQENIIQTKPNGEFEILINGIEKIERNDKDCANFGQYKERKGQTQDEIQLEIKKEKEKCGQNQTLQSDEFLMLIDMTIWNKSENSLDYFGDLKMTLDNGKTELNTNFDSFANIGSREFPKFSRFLGSSDKARGKVFWKIKNQDQDLDYKLKIAKFKENLEINLGKINENKKFGNNSTNSNENFETPKNAKILKFTQNNEINTERKHYKTGEKLNYKTKIESLGCQDFTFEKLENGQTKYFYENDRLKIGYKYLKCQTRITNQSSFALKLDSNLSVKNKNGQTFEALNEGLFSKFSFYDNLLPNDAIMSENYFEVPQNFGEYRLYVTSPIYSYQGIVIIFE